MLFSSPFNFCLHCFPLIQRDNGFMGSFRMVHCLLPVVWYRFLRDVAFAEKPLKEQIARVGVVPQNLCNRLRMPCLTVSGGLNALVVQPCCDAVSTHAVEKFSINAANQRRLLRNDVVFAILHSVAEHSAVPRDTRFKVPFDTPLLVFADGAAFLLGIRCQDGQHQLTVSAHGVDVLLFKEHIDTQAFQLSDGFQKSDRVSGKA